MIVLDGLTKRYGSHVAVHAVTASIRPGRVTGLLGPDGSGRTTILRCILGLTRPTSGSAVVLGRRYRQLARPLRSVGALVALSRERRGIRPPGRLSGDAQVPLWEPGQTAYVCGSAAFAETASQLLVGLGIPPGDVRVERFGPSG